MNRKILFVLLISVSGLLYAQQLTRIAVVDLNKAYMAFFADSRAVREFEERSARVQNDIDRMTREIQALRSQYADAVLYNNQTEALRLENLIYRQTEYLRDYHQIRTQELETQKRNLMQSGTFLDQVYSEIRFIAETEGYSMIMNLNENDVIIWYSPTIDITDKLISNLRTKARN
ncbi:MAG: OmpH family outer membrane protein [Treponema sp.]|nr:OmpH family outer membrane protein [Treponema sp.]